MTIALCVFPTTQIRYFHNRNTSHGLANTFLDAETITSAYMLGSMLIGNITTTQDSSALLYFRTYEEKRTSTRKKCAV
jgi:hypothetical protein